MAVSRETEYVLAERLTTATSGMREIDARPLMVSLKGGIVGPPKVSKVHGVWTEGAKTDVEEREVKI